MRGRKPKPPEQHILNGNPSRLNLEKRQKFIEKLDRKIPQPPAELDQRGREYWLEIVPALQKAGILATADAGALFGLCESYALMKAAAASLKKLAETIKAKIEAGEVDDISDSIFYYKTSNGIYRQYPQLAQFKEASVIYKAYASEFGLTPSSRMRVDLDQKFDADSEMETILRETETRGRMKTEKTIKKTVKHKLKKLKKGEMWPELS